MLFPFFWLLVIPGVIGQYGKSERIINGFNATISMFPHQVGLIYFNHLFCGGSIISEKIILTAAHCVYKLNPRDFQISIGSSFYSKGSKYKVSKVIEHPYYNHDTTLYDVAILKLSKSLKFSSTVQPIELQPLYAEVPEGTEAFVSGWGQININKYTPRLQATKVRIISNKNCEKYYKNLSYPYLCAIDKYSGTCCGDSGGPLIANNKLIGIVSFGIGECDPPNPGVYANVSYVRNFIDLYL